MAERPTGEELIKAVREHLMARLLPTLSDPQLRFQTLVAAHVLGVVEREIALGEQPLWQGWAALCALLGDRRPQPSSIARLRAETEELNRQLAEQIRAGERDDDPNVPLLLKQQVAQKLALWNPAFRTER